MAFNCTGGGRDAVEKILRQLDSEFNWGVCLLQEVGTSGLILPSGDSQPAYYSFGTTAGLFVHKSETWRGLGVLLNLEVVKPTKAWAGNSSLTVLVRDSHIRRCFMLFTSVHLPQPQKAWHTFSDSVMSLDRVLREAPGQLDHLVFHCLGGDFNVQLDVDDWGVCAKEDRGDLVLGVCRHNGFEIMGDIDESGPRPVLRHTFFSVSGCLARVWTILLFADSGRFGTYSLSQLPWSVISGSLPIPTMRCSNCPSN